MSVPARVRMCPYLQRAGPPSPLRVATRFSSPLVQASSPPPPSCRHPASIHLDTVCRSHITHRQSPARSPLAAHSHPARMIGTGCFSRPRLSRAQPLRAFRGGHAGTGDPASPFTKAGTLAQTLYRPPTEAGWSRDREKGGLITKSSDICKGSRYFIKS